LACALAAALAAGACGLRARGEPATEPTPRVVASEPIDLAGVRPAVDLDSLAAALSADADTLAASDLPALEGVIRDWLARLEFEDPVLLPLGEPAPRRFFRRYRGRLLDSLGWSALRRRDLRQAEAALATAIEEINSRGTTSGYALHFYHMGELQAARGRWAAAAESYLDAEVRGMGEAATPALERAFRRRYGSLRGLEAARGRELARVEDERHQQLIEGSERRPLPPFVWPRRTGAPMASGELAGRTTVIAAWDGACEGCAGWPARLGPLAEALRARGGTLVAVWLGGNAAAAGPPQAFAVLAPPDPAAARRLLGIERLPALLVVDAAGRVRYRHAGPAAVHPPAGDVIVQFDHLRRSVPESRP
jgi:hypothetical protein